MILANLVSAVGCADKEVTMRAVHVVACDNSNDSIDLIDDGERVTHYQLRNSPGCDIWKRSDLWDLTAKPLGDAQLWFISAQTAF
jgi:hypothetical protein